VVDAEFLCGPLAITYWTSSFLICWLMAAFVELMSPDYCCLVAANVSCGKQ